MVAGCLTALATAGCQSQINFGDDNRPFNNGERHRHEPAVYTYDERNSIDRVIADTDDLPPPTKPAALPHAKPPAKKVVVKKPDCGCSGTTHKKYLKPAPLDTGDRKVKQD